MITGSEALKRLLDHNELFYDEIQTLFREMLSGKMAPELIAALLMGLRMKVETVSEVAAAAEVMREFAIRVPVHHPEELLDIVGTGGDGLKTFNISTTALFVAAAMGAKIAKHGGSAVSSSSGASDVMQEMGMQYLPPAMIARSIEETQIGFMAAASHNPALRYVMSVRQILGVRTLFNILGPLVNPARAGKQFLGVFHHDLLGIYAHVGKNLGVKRMLVVHGCDGMDEITVSGPTFATELKEGEIKSFVIHPEDLGMELYKDLSPLEVHSAKQSLTKIDAVLAGEKVVARDIVLLNAGAALYCAGIADSLAEGVALAREGIDSGKAQEKKHTYIAWTQQVAYRGN